MKLISFAELLVVRGRFNSGPAWCSFRNGSRRGLRRGCGTGGGPLIWLLMRLLLDTQVMLWWLIDDARLDPDTRQLIVHRLCVVSVASIWEVAIKLLKG